MEHTDSPPILLSSPAFPAMNTLDDFLRSVSRWQTLLSDLDGEIALPQIRTSKGEKPLQSAYHSNSDAIINGDHPNAQQNGVDLIYHVAETKDTSTRPYQQEMAPASLHPPPTTPKLLHQKSAECLVGSTQPPISQVSHKRKASSTGGKSMPSKYRTRHMIVVEYDSRVQTAFERIVQFLGLCRNVMRKENAAARTRRFKKLADDAKACDLIEYEKTSGTGHNGLGGAEYNVLQIDVQETAVAHSVPVATDAEDVPNIKMFALRARNKGESPKSIYSELDSGLEWCQSVCEKAAHQILRDGTIEIEGLKRRFAELIKLAEEIEQSTQKW